MEGDGGMDAGKNNLGDGVEGSADVQNALGIAGNTFGDHNTGTTLFANFVDVRAALANDNRCILGDDEAPHVDVACRCCSRR